MEDSRPILTNPDKKYWIKQGISVCHKSNPERVMIVDRILQKTVVKKIGLKEISKVWTIGVECHWVSDNGEYQKGRFFTNELVKAKS